MSLKINDSGVSSIVEKLSSVVEDVGNFLKKVDTFSNYCETEFDAWLREGRGGTHVNRYYVSPSRNTFVDELGNIDDNAYNKAKEAALRIAKEKVAADVKLGQNALSSLKTSVTEKKNNAEKYLKKVIKALNKVQQLEEEFDTTTPPNFDGLAETIGAASRRRLGSLYKSSLSSSDTDSNYYLRLYFEELTGSKVSGKQLYLLTNGGDNFPWFGVLNNKTGRTFMDSLTETGANFIDGKNGNFFWLTEGASLGINGLFLGRNLDIVNDEYDEEGSKTSKELYNGYTNYLLPTFDGEILNGNDYNTGAFAAREILNFWGVDDELTNRLRLLPVFDENGETPKSVSVVEEDGTTGGFLAGSGSLLTILGNNLLNPGGWIHNTNIEGVSVSDNYNNVPKNIAIETSENFLTNIFSGTGKNGSNGSGKSGVGGTPYGDIYGKIIHTPGYGDVPKAIQSRDNFTQAQELVSVSNNDNGMFKSPTVFESISPADTKISVGKFEPATQVNVENFNEKIENSAQILSGDSPASTILSNTTSSKTPSISESLAGSLEGALPSINSGINSLPGSSVNPIIGGSDVGLGGINLPGVNIPNVSVPNITITNINPGINVGSGSGLNIPSLETSGVYNNVNFSATPSLNNIQSPNQLMESLNSLPESVRNKIASMDLDNRTESAYYNSMSNEEFDDIKNKQVTKFRSMTKEQIKEKLRKQGYNEKDSEIIANNENIGVVAFLVGEQNVTMEALRRAISNGESNESEIKNPTLEELVSGEAAARLLNPYQDEEVKKASEEYEYIKEKYNRAVTKSNLSSKSLKIANEKLKKTRIDIEQIDGKDINKWTKEHISKYNDAVKVFMEEKEVASKDLEETIEIEKELHKAMEILKQAKDNFNKKIASEHASSDPDLLLLVGTKKEEEEDKKEEKPKKEPFVMISKKKVMPDLQMYNLDGVEILEDTGSLSASDKAIVEQNVSQSVDTYKDDQQLIENRPAENVPKEETVGKMEINGKEISITKPTNNFVEAPENE